MICQFAPYNGHLISSRTGNENQHDNIWSMAISIGITSIGQRIIDYCLVSFYSALSLYTNVHRYVVLLYLADCSIWVSGNVMAVAFYCLLRFSEFGSWYRRLLHALFLFSRINFFSIKQSRSSCQLCLLIFHFYGTKDRCNLCKGIGKSSRCDWLGQIANSNITLGNGNIEIGNWHFHNAK